MAEQPEVVEAEARRLLAVKVQVRWNEIGDVAMSALERVWTHIRNSNLRGYGHNVFLYENPTREGADISMGVEVPEDVQAPEGFVITHTPAGRVATAAHIGSYDGLAAATQALIAACAEHDLELAGSSWEVYGDNTGNPATLRTDIFIQLKT
jgi:effector-binding domain-containing protein